MTRAAIRVATAGLAGLAVATVAVLPPPAGAAVGDRAVTDVAVAFHVHTNRSDGTGSRHDVARAAARAGLAAVVLTDHGDAMRAADPPEYIDGVLVLDGVEISTWGGHYAAVDLAPAPYPLGGEPAAVVEDVARLGGVGIVAHPGSSKDGLRWRDWDAPFDGVEWLNADSEWRDRPLRLWRTALAYPWRPGEALAALVDVPAFELGRWDQLIARRPVIGLAAHDAHARLGLRGVGEPYDGWIALDAPSYESQFRSFANYLRLAAPLSGAATADAAAIVAALRSGRVYGVVTGVAPPGRLSFEARSAGRSATMGGHLVPDGATALTVDIDVPAGARTMLVCGGAVVAETAGGRVAWTSESAPGACRVEVRLRRSSRELPWLVANPIYVRERLGVDGPRDILPAVHTMPVAGSTDPAVWTIETASDATARVAASAAIAAAIDFSWRLGAGAETYAAAQLAAPAGLTAFDSLVVRAAADRPLRAWVQLRAPGGGERWGRSVYLDGTPREIRLPFAAMLALDAGSTRARPADVTSLLLVVDTVHAVPGSQGRITITDVQLAR